MFLWEDPVLVLQKKRSCLLICLFLYYIYAFFNITSYVILILMIIFLFIIYLFVS